MDASYREDVELALALMMAEENATGNHQHPHQHGAGGHGGSLDAIMAADMDAALALSLQQEEDQQAQGSDRSLYSAGSAGAGFGYQGPASSPGHAQTNGFVGHQQQYQQPSTWEEEEQLAIAMSMQDTTYDPFGNNESHLNSSKEQLLSLQQEEYNQAQSSAAKLPATPQEKKNGFLDHQQHPQTTNNWEEEEQLAIAMSMQDTKYDPFSREMLTKPEGHLPLQEEEKKPAAIRPHQEEKDSGFEDQPKQNQHHQQSSSWEDWQKKTGIDVDHQQFYHRTSNWEEEEEQLVIAMSIQERKCFPLSNGPRKPERRPSLQEEEKKQAATKPHQEEEESGFGDQPPKNQHHQQPSSWEDWEEDEKLAIAMSMQDTKYDPFSDKETQTNSGVEQRSNHDHQVALAQANKKEPKSSRSSFVLAGRDSLFGETVLDCHDDYHIALEQARRDTEAATDASITGKAWNFVRAVIEEHQNIIASDQANKGNAHKLMMETIGVDDMMFTAEQLFATRAIFLQESIPGLESEKDTRIDIGYHYTRSENLEYIKANGLLTKEERDQRGVATNYNGSAFGDGVYTGNDPFAFSNYGDTGLLVARLKGAIAPACRNGFGFVGDTAIATKGGRHQMVILRQSSQCVPLLRFQTPQNPDTHMDNAIWYAHRRLQDIVDRFFNDGIKTEVLAVPRQPTVVIRPPVSASVLTPPPAPYVGKMPPSSLTKSENGTPDWYQDYKQKLRKNWSSASEVKKQQTDSPCESETFRRAGDSEEYNNRLSEAMRVMKYSKEKVTCENMDTLVVVYAFRREDINSQEQDKDNQEKDNDSDEIENDKDYKLIHRVEYHPDTPENRAVIERLKHAFCTGILSLHTWSMIPHRTSPYLSYKNYALECVDALQQLEFPTEIAADDCSANVKVGTMNVTPPETLGATPATARSAASNETRTVDRPRACTPSNRTFTV